MTLTIFLMVLVAALLHAVWNALVKGSADKSLNMAAVVLGQGFFGLLCLPFVAIPAVESWPWILLSVVLHIGYQFFLLGAYRIGDLTQVYPIARGTAPMLVAAVSIFILGVELSLVEIAGVLIIGAGIISLCLVRQADGLRNGNAAVLAVLTGCFIASYSLCDGHGARLAATAVGFYAWSSMGNAVVFAAIVGATRPRLVRELPGAYRIFLIGGGASYLAYVLVVYGFTQAPIALITALRETSIVFALLIGVFCLRERLDLWKVLSTTVTICGAAVLRLSKG